MIICVPSLNHFLLAETSTTLNVFSFWSLGSSASIPASLHIFRYSMMAGVTRSPGMSLGMPGG
jgi:hypothetical protein